MTDRDRGQMVLLTVVTIGAALAPMLLAYMQFGYHPDVAKPEYNYASDVIRTLERALVSATEGFLGGDSPYDSQFER